MLGGWANSRVIDVPKASCWGGVDVDQTLQRAVEQLLDMEHELAFRFLVRFRKRVEQVENEGSPPFQFFLAFRSACRTGTGDG